LCLTGEYNQNLTMAARNMKDVEVREVATLDPVGLVNSESILLSSKALRDLENSLR
jgi:large subunit ribosomal protein L4